MLSDVQIFGLGFVALFVFYETFDSLWSWHRARQAAAALSCKPPNVCPTGFLGIPGTFKLIDSVRNCTTLQVLSEEHDLYGNTFVRPAPGGRLLITCEPENLKAMLATQFNEFGLGHRYEHFYPLLGDGIFTLDGAGWSHSRAMLRPQFSREQVADIHALEIHVDHLVSCFPRPGQAFDIQELFFRLTLDSATEFLFGESVNSLVSSSATQSGVPVKSTENVLGFEDAFNLSQDYLASRSRAQKLYWLINPAAFKRSNKVVHKLVDYYVAKALEATNKKIDNEKNGRYIFLNAVAQETRDPKALRDQALNILLAGRDTTSALLSSVFWLLARNPRVWEKLRTEILNAFGTLDSPKGQITFSSLKDISYLRHVMDEALRLFPPVPLNFRTALKDTTIPRGGGPDGRSPVFVEKGKDVGYSVYVMHRRKDLWGADANDFRPERWAEGKSFQNWQFLPFNGGPRICLGQQYALTEAGFVIAKLLQRYERVENADTHMGDAVIDANLTMKHHHGVRVRLYSAA
ncbi:cytochrome P450 [Xylogone sp. PMI_703]|nr:cytochrome P450 [Xylogone sp. PMI_703]